LFASLRAEFPKLNGTAVPLTALFAPEGNPKERTVTRFLATGFCLAAIAALSNPALANSCVPQQQAKHTTRTQTAQSSTHRYVRVSERREDERMDYGRMDRPYYEYYDERYVPPPRRGWWVWHPAPAYPDDYGPGPYSHW
jgi:hypothetical protein